VAALVGPVHNIFFLTGHYFTSFVPHRPESWAVSRTALRLSLKKMSLDRTVAGLRHIKRIYAQHSKKLIATTVSGKAGEEN
jgi:hypothetical protein